MTRVKLPGYSKESELRQAAKKLALERGYIVRDLSVPRRTMKQWDHLADWLVRHPNWEKGQWILIEWKNGYGSWHWSDEKQEEDYAKGNILTFWYEQDLVKWMDAQERRN